MAQLRVDLELLRKMLGLPDHVEIVGAKTSVDESGMRSVALFDLQGSEACEGAVDAEYQTDLGGGHRGWMSDSRFTGFRPTGLVEVRGRLVPEENGDDR